MWNISEYSRTGVSDHGSDLEMHFDKVEMEFCLDQVRTLVVLLFGVVVMDSALL